MNEFWSMVFNLYMLSVFEPLWTKNVSFFIRVHKIIFICWLHLDLDANFTASYPDQLSICFNIVFIKSLVAVSWRSSFHAYSLETSVYLKIDIALIYPVLQICILKCTFQSISLCSLKLSWIWMDERQKLIQFLSQSIQSLAVSVCTL